MMPLKLRPHLGDRLRFPGAAVAEHVKLGNPVRLPVPAGPQDAEASLVLQDPGDLRRGPGRIEPVPRGRDENRVGEGVGQRDLLGRPGQHLDPR
ncbi:MAG TPA: hypothetical protein VMU95_41560 [Trebonia sp.]|nr:hypothetical protein [Trebonia sp.]